MNRSIIFLYFIFLSFDLGVKYDRGMIWTKVLLIIKRFINVH